MNIYCQLEAISKILEDISIEPEVARSLFEKIWCAGYDEGYKNGKADGLADDFGCDSIPKSASDAWNEKTK